MPPTLATLLNAIEAMKRADHTPAFYDLRAVRSQAEDAWFDAGCPRPVRLVGGISPLAGTSNIGRK